MLENNPHTKGLQNTTMDDRAAVCNVRTSLAHPNSGSVNCRYGKLQSAFPWK